MVLAFGSLNVGDDAPPPTPWLVLLANDIEMSWTAGAKRDVLRQCMSAPFLGEGRWPQQFAGGSVTVWTVPSKGISWLWSDWARTCDTRAAMLYGQLDVSAEVVGDGGGARRWYISIMGADNVQDLAQALVSVQQMLLPATKDAASVKAQLQRFDKLSPMLCLAFMLDCLSYSGDGEPPLLPCAVDGGEYRLVLAATLACWNMTWLEQALGDTAACMAATLRQQRQQQLNLPAELWYGAEADVSFAHLLRPWWGRVWACASPFASVPFVPRAREFAATVAEAIGIDRAARGVNAEQLEHVHGLWFWFQATAQRVLERVDDAAAPAGWLADLQLLARGMRLVTDAMQQQLKFIRGVTCADTASVLPYAIAACPSSVPLIRVSGIGAAAAAGTATMMPWQDFRRQFARYELLVGRDGSHVVAGGHPLAMLQSVWLAHEKAAGTLAEAEHRRGGVWVGQRAGCWTEVGKSHDVDVFRVGAFDASKPALMTVVADCEGDGTLAMHAWEAPATITRAMASDNMWWAIAKVRNKAVDGGSERYAQAGMCVETWIPSPSGTTLRRKELQFMSASGGEGDGKCEDGEAEDAPGWVGLFGPAAAQEGDTTTPLLDKFDFEALAVAWVAATDAERARGGSPVSLAMRPGALVALLTGTTHVVPMMFRPFAWHLCGMEVVNRTIRHQFARVRRMNHKGFFISDVEMRVSRATDHTALYFDECANAWKLRDNRSAWASRGMSHTPRQQLEYRLSHDFAGIGVVRVAAQMKRMHKHAGMRLVGPSAVRAAAAAEAGSSDSSDSTLQWEALHKWMCRV